MFLSSTGKSFRTVFELFIDLFSVSLLAVFMAELVKLLTCLVLVFFEEGEDFQRFIKKLHITVVKNYMDTVKICVPSFVYIVQNNLLYLSASHLDAATYQVITALKYVNFLDTLDFLVSFTSGLGDLSAKNLDNGNVRGWHFTQKAHINAMGCSYVFGGRCSSRSVG